MSTAEPNVLYTTFKFLRLHGNGWLDMRAISRNAVSPFSAWKRDLGIETREGNVTQLG